MVTKRLRPPTAVALPTPRATARPAAAAARPPGASARTSEPPASSRWPCGRPRRSSRGGRPASRSSMNPTICRDVLPMRRGSRGLKSGSVQDGSSQMRRSRAPVQSSQRSRSQKIEPFVPTIVVLVVAPAPEARRSDFVAEEDLGDDAVGHADLDERRGIRLAGQVREVVEVGVDPRRVDAGDPAHAVAGVGAPVEERIALARDRRASSAGRSRSPAPA